MHLPSVAGTCRGRYRILDLYLVSYLSGGPIPRFAFE
jgi:hypothetical protein